MTKFVSSDRCNLFSLRVRLSLLLVVSAVWLPPATSHAQTWTQELPADSPSARGFFTIAYDASDFKVVLFGGENVSSVLDHTFVWDDANWTQQDPAHSPPKRYEASMAYDAADGKVVLFGGETSSTKGRTTELGLLSDTWVWNGTDWQQEHPAKSPSVRGYGSMAYDAAAGKVLLFGGYNFSSLLSDTWVWNGTDWAQEHPANSPPARSNAAMAYDEAQSQVVLFGGLDSNGEVLGDTWVWNGTDWTQEFFEDPPLARYGAGMAFDAAEGQVVMFGGENNQGDYLSDTWVWR
jgi:Kelch motif/Galactose oxidase, central domain